MRFALYALAAVAVGLLAGTAKACDYNVRAVNAVAVGGYVNTVAVAVPTYQAVTVVPTVASFVQVQPVFVAQKVAVVKNVVAVNKVFVGGGNVVSNGRGQVAVQGGGNVNQQSGLVNLAVGGGRGGNVNQLRGLVNLRLGR
jgi:hypothetical protein